MAATVAKILVNFADGNAVAVALAEDDDRPARAGAGDKPSPVVVAQNGADPGEVLPFVCVDSCRRAEEYIGYTWDHLPIFKGACVGARAKVANLAIFAACMAFSSLFSRSRLR